MRVMIAMTAAGIGTFAQLYAVQAVLPGLAESFDASAASAALSVSFATGGLAVFTLVWSGAADRFGRVTIMATALTVSTLLGLAAPFSPDMWVLLAVRAAQGATLGGVPAVAMAYLAEEIDPGYLARVTGVYIAGNAIGGMSGRLVAGVVADVGGWRWGVGADSVLALVALVVFLVVVPRTRGFVASRRRADGPGLGRRVARSFADPGLVALYCQALFLMGAFVTVYNYLGFRVMAEPFGLSQTVVALLFVAYLAGIVGSTTAGRLIERVGRHPVLLTGVAGMTVSVAALLTPSLVVVALALLVLTFCFFAAHTTASAWIGHRATAEARAQAAALYTLAYYGGSSVLGWLGGVVYDRVGWAALLGYVGALCAMAALTGVGLRSRRTM